jgi:ElaB/YqjD/DUF883 family membrane-anchored ribosome-binding protein
MKKTSHHVEEDRSRITRERMLADLGAIAADADALLQATTADMGEKAKDTRARLSAAVEKTKATYQEFKMPDMDSARAALSETDQAIREHPYKALVIAFWRWHSGRLSCDRDDRHR